MSELEHTANEEARHGNREALEAMTKRAEILEELVMDVAADLHEGVSRDKIDYRIGKVMQKLEWDEDV
jgi:hypothetical protein